MQSPLPTVCVHVSELYVYPIKSARGIAVERAPLDERGFLFDRRWMLTDMDGVFISQREEHTMALIDVTMSPVGVTVSAPGMEHLVLPFTSTFEPMQCRIWDDVVDAVPVSPPVHEWFSTFLGRKCQLVYMPDETRRIVDRDYVADERVVGFADAFPLLIIGEGSLGQLNDKLESVGHTRIPIKRFRPNIVVAGTKPHEEDEWKHIRIGDIDVDVVKPCARCAITTVNTDTAEAGHEPLRTLSSYRKVGSKVMFGQNAVHRGMGTIRVGDEITQRSQNWDERCSRT